MVYTNKEDKKQIKKALQMFFTEHDTTLRAFCLKHGYSYAMIYQKLTTNNISHDLVNEMIHKIDKTRSLQKLHKTFAISRRM